MKWRPSPFNDDVVTLTWRDIVALVLGRELRCGPCVVRRGSDA